MIVNQENLSNYVRSLNATPVNCHYFLGCRSNIQGNNSNNYHA